MFFQFLTFEKSEFCNGCTSVARVFDRHFGSVGKVSCDWCIDDPLFAHRFKKANGIVVFLDFSICHHLVKFLMSWVGFCNY